MIDYFYLQNGIWKRCNKPKNGIWCKHNQELDNYKNKLIKFFNYPDKNIYAKDSIRNNDFITEILFPNLDSALIYNLS